MPFPNEHALRLRQPDRFDPDSFRRTKGGTLFGGNLKVPNSISLIWGKLKDSSAADDPVILQALRFPKAQWTVDSAKAWIQKNLDGRGIFEAASVSDNNSENVALTDKDLEKAIMQGNLAEYNMGDEIPYDDILNMKTTIDFDDKEIPNTAIIAAQLMQLNTDIDTQEDLTNTETDTSAASHDAETQDIENIEIFQAGTWKDVVYTRDDLDEISANFTKLREQIKPPVKLGHDENQALLQVDGMPSAGWITNLRREGDKLVCDLTDVPRKIARIIKNRNYKRVSSEIYTNLKDKTGKLHGMVLKAVALLGGDIPHLKSLDDIVAQYDNLPDNEIRRVILMAETLREETSEESEETTDQTTDETTTEDTTQETTQDEATTDEASTTDESTDTDTEESEEEEEETVEDTTDTATNDTADMEAKMAEQAAEIKRMKEKEQVRDQVMASLQTKMKAQEDEKNLVADEAFLSDLTQKGIFPPSMKAKGLALMTALRTSEEEVITYTEDGADSPVETNRYALIKQFFTDMPKGMSLNETASGPEIIDPGSGRTITHTEDGTKVYGQKEADLVTKYMEEHEGVTFDEAYKVIYTQMHS